MRKIFSIILSIACSITMLAQTPDNPNRMLVVKPNGTFKAYDVDRVSEIKFANVEGRVACDIDFTSCTLTSVTCELYMDEACESYLINVLPGVIVKQMEANPATAGDYMQFYNSPEGNLEGPGITLSGLELNAGTEYALVTVGIDKYGCEGELCAAYFNTPAAPIVGNPEVKVEVKNVTKTSAQLKFTANADVKTFSAVLGPKGELELQYQQFAPMMGFTNIGDMVVGWGAKFNGNGTYTYEWDGLDPNTEYEVYVQPLDKNGAYANLVIQDVKTLVQGGEGEANVTITTGDYTLQQWGDELLPSQFITYTPNDQTWRYRIGVYLENEYNEKKDLIIEDLCSEPEMSIAYWWQYETLTTDYPIDPNTTVVIIAAAQNAKGEWGPVTEKKYTTPATAPGLKPAKVNSVKKSGYSITSRYDNAMPASEQGKVRNHRITLSK